MAESTWRLMVNDWKRRRLGNRYDQTYADLYLTEDFGGRLARCVERMELSLVHDDLLDIGCGTGMLLPLLKNKVRKYVGIDDSEAMIDAARSIHGDTEDLSFFKNLGVKQLAPRNFTVVTLFDAEHVANEDLRIMLEALKKILKGRLYIHTPNGDYFMEKLKKAGLLPQISGHISVRNGLELAALLERAGFKVTRIDYMPHYTPLLRWTEWFANLPVIGKYFRARLWIEAYC